MKIKHQVVVFDAAELAAESVFWAGLLGCTAEAASRTAHDAAVISLDDARQRCEQRKQKRNGTRITRNGDDPVPILGGAPAWGWRS